MEAGIKGNQAILAGRGHRMGSPPPALIVPLVQVPSLLPSPPGWYHSSAECEKERSYYLEKPISAERFIQVHLVNHHSCGSQSFGCPSPCCFLRVSLLALVKYTCPWVPARQWWTIRVVYFHQVREFTQTVKQIKQWACFILYIFLIGRNFCFLYFPIINVCWVPSWF